jgi:hypothetical protein
MRDLSRSCAVLQNTYCRDGTSSAESEEMEKVLGRSEQ